MAERGIKLISDFHESMVSRVQQAIPEDWLIIKGPVPGRQAYDSFMQSIREAYDAKKVQQGVFGAMMDVSLINDVRSDLLSPAIYARNGRC